MVAGGAAPHVDENFPHRRRAIDQTNAPNRSMHSRVAWESPCATRSNTHVASGRRGRGADASSQVNVMSEAGNKAETVTSVLSL
jgi:hypothetical protein